MEKAGGTQLSSKLYSLVIGCETGWGVHRGSARVVKAHPGTHAGL